MADWRIDLVEGLWGQRLVRSKYSRHSEEWDHDHCVACGATFSELDGPGYQHDGYTTGPEYSHGREYEWVCLQCFNDLKGELGWSVGDQKSNWDTSQNNLGHSGSITDSTPCSVEFAGPMTPPDKNDLLLSSEIIALSAEPLIGQLRLTTDNGDVVVVAINHVSAQALVDQLNTFLDTE